MLEKSNIVLVFIYADWCPHCHTYRDEVWNKLKGTPGRNMAMAAVNSDVAENALNGFMDSATRQPARADGYPTVMLVENGSKEAVKIESARNLPAMSRLVNNANNLGTKSTSVATPMEAFKPVLNTRPAITAPNNQRANTIPIETFSESIENAGNSVVAAAMKASPLKAAGVAAAAAKPIASPLKLGEPEMEGNLGHMLDQVEPPALQQRGGSLLDALRAYERTNRSRRYDLQ